MLEKMKSKHYVYKFIAYKISEGKKLSLLAVLSLDNDNCNINKDQKELLKKCL